MPKHTDLKQAIAAQEQLRGRVPDAVVDASITALRKQLEALDIATPDEQRKLVTVLFADLAGWTKMAEQMDPEDVQAIQCAYFSAVTPAIEQHGGAVEKYIGDAVLAVFGVPHAHEDDPERALRAALAMQDAISDLNDSLPTSDLPTSDPPSLRLRIGIHTGLVVAAIDADGDFVITGDTVNLASRLESAARPGTVLISEETNKLVAYAFEIEAQTPIQVKGKTEAVVAYRVMRSRIPTWRASHRPVAGMQTAFIGRADELTTLQQTCQDVVDQEQTRVITVIGDAGVGKSRLLDEFDAWLDDQIETGRVFKGRAAAITQNMPYSVLRDLVATHCDLRIDDTAEVVREKIEGGLGQLLGTDPRGRMKVHFIGQLLGYDFSASPHLQGALDDAEQIRNRALRYLGEFFTASVDQDPAILFFEDFHWADDSSLRAIRHFIEHIDDQASVLIVVLARPSLHERRPEWNEDHPYHTHIHLQPLSETSSRRLVAEILQRVEQMPEALGNLIVDRAEGNPFYVEELIKMLVEDGVIVPDETQWQVRTERMRELRVPTTVTGVLQARLDRLPKQTRTLLQQASVIGRIFWDQTLMSLESAGSVAAQEESVPGELTELRQREMVFQNEVSTFAEAQEYLFKHALLRDVAYESVLKRLRRRYHGLVADWLLIHGGERASEFNGLIADHLELAGRTAEAIKYLERASRQAASQYANDEAIRYDQRALHLLGAERDPLSAEQRQTLVRINEHLADLYDLVGRSEEAQQAWEQALALSSQENRTTQARIQRKLADYLALDFDKARQAYTNALDLLGSEPSEKNADWWSEWIDVRLWEAELYYWHKQPQEMQNRLDELRPFIESHGTPSQKADLFGGLNQVRFMLERFQLSAQTVDYSRENLAIHQEIGNMRRIASSQFGLGFSLLWHGDVTIALIELDRALELAREVGDAMIQCRCLIYLAYCYRFMGDLDRTTDYAQRSLDLAVSCDIDLYIGPAKNHLAWVAWRCGNREEAEALAENGLSGHWHPLQWGAHWPLLAIALEQQQIEIGIEHARQMLAPSQQRLPDGQTEALEAAIAAWESDDRELAQVNLTRAMREAEKTNHL